MKNDRELDKMVSQMGLKGMPKKAVVQYAKGMQEGMRLAYTAAARRLRARGWSEEELRAFLDKLAEEDQIDAILRESEN